MSRLNTIMKLVTNTKYDGEYMALPTPSPFTLAGVNSRNEVIIAFYNPKTEYTRRHRIPKMKVVQIVAGFSEIA